MKERREIEFELTNHGIMKERKKVEEKCERELED